MSRPTERAEAGDQVRVSVTVRVSIESAFELFTGEIDRWWRRPARCRIRADDRIVVGQADELAQAIGRARC